MQPDFEQQLRQATLGDDLVLRSETREEIASACLYMTLQATHKLDIVSRDLEPVIFDNNEYYDAMKQLAMRHSRSKIRILIQNSEYIVKHGHCLVGLSQRLSSYIDIRIQGKDYREFNEAWLIADNLGFIRRPQADRYKGECYFNAAREVQDRTRQFDEMWAGSHADPNLRRLHI